MLPSACLNTRECQRSFKSYQGLIGDQSVPDAGHGLANAQVGVKLVAVETGHELGQERSQLLPSLGCDHVEAESCSLKGGERPGGRVRRAEVAYVMNRAED